MRRLAAGNQAHLDTLSLRGSCDARQAVLASDGPTSP